MNRVVLALAVLASILGGVAIGQNSPFPGSQPVVNQVMQIRAVTPSDTVNLPIAKALFNGNATACNLAVVAAGDQAGGQQTMFNVAPGTWQPVTAWRVMATNTTCTNILAGY